MAFTIEVINNKLIDSHNKLDANLKMNNAILLPIKEKYLFLNLLKNNFNVIKNRLENSDKIDNKLLEKAINFIVMEFSLADDTFFNLKDVFEMFINYLNGKESYFNAD